MIFVDGFAKLAVQVLLTQTFLSYIEVIKSPIYYKLNSYFNFLNAQEEGDIFKYFCL